MRLTEKQMLSSHVHTCLVKNKTDWQRFNYNSLFLFYFIFLAVYF